MAERGRSACNRSLLAFQFSHGQGAIEPSLIAPAAGTLKSQGATQLPVATYCPMLRAQGATEYLVLLAVVLVIALVAIALLGFFPGMAGDAQETQSKMYWQSATPIAITEWGAKYMQSPGTEPNANYTVPYFRIRNNGMYTITLKKILAGNASTTAVFTGGWVPGIALSSAYVIAPGEEKTIGPSQFWLPDPGSGNRRFMMFSWAASGGLSSYDFYDQALSYCNPRAPFGSLVVQNFGFEYDIAIEGKTITKRQVAPSPLMIKCINNYN